MKTADFDYVLPPEFIAQKPIRPRDHAKLMIINRQQKTLEHRKFYNLIDYLEPGDLLVWNNSKVFKARLFGYLEAVDKDINKDGQIDKPLFKPAKVEIFLVKPMPNKGVWQVLGRPGRRVKLGMRIRFAPDFYCDVVAKEPSGEILVQFYLNEVEVRNKANQYGHVPLPPYIKTQINELSTYQTIYAKNEGSVAAPTAGFHFSSDLINKLKNKGVEFANVTLHVGLGTFLPVKTENIFEHKMHKEWVELSDETIEKIKQAELNNKKIIAVGTTSVRTLEGIANIKAKLFTKEKYQPKHGFEYLQPYQGDINLFIYPGFEFKIINGLVTNFHLPKSTLLMLVSAFIGSREFTLQAYEIAKQKKYRFYSFGDAMFVY